MKRWYIWVIVVGGGSNLIRSISWRRQLRSVSITCHLRCSWVQIFSNLWWCVPLHWVTSKFHFQLGVKKFEYPWENIIYSKTICDKMLILCWHFKESWFYLCTKTELDTSTDASAIWFWKSVATSPSLKKPTFDTDGASKALKLNNYLHGFGS